MSTSNAKQLRKISTDAERTLWKHLRAYQVNRHKFRRQQPIGPYIVDFVCFEHKLIIEVDGGQHARPDEAEYDEARTEWLESQGFHVLRFWNNQVLREIGPLKQAILKPWKPFIHLSNRERAPSPLMGEGWDEGFRNEQV